MSERLDIVLELTFLNLALLRSLTDVL